MNEQLKNFITKYIWIVIVLFCIRCLISGEGLINNFSVYDIFGYSGEAISVATFIMLLYERVLWKYDPFNCTPVLYKSYSGTIISSYDNISRQSSLEIKQTLLTVKVICTTGESKSKSVCASIYELCGEKKLTYCYLSEPDALVRSRSPIHYGNAMLCVDNPKKLKGQYFTDRKTIGDMRFDADIVRNN